MSETATETEALNLPLCQFVQMPGAGRICSLSRDDFSRTKHYLNVKIVCMNNLPIRFQEYIDFRGKYRKFFGEIGDYRKGEIEIVDDPKLFVKCEVSAAKQMIEEGISEREAHERAKIGIREENRWGVSVCEPVRLPTGAYGTFVRFISWGQLETGVAGMVIVPVTKDGKLLLLKNFRNATRTWALEFLRGTKDPGESLQKTLEEEVEEEGGARLLAKPKLIGQITPDSGVLATRADVYFVRVEVYRRPFPQVTEAIKGIVFLTKEEFKKAIKEGQYKDKKGEVYDFSDGYTISAFAKASERGLI